MTKKSKDLKSFTELKKGDKVDLGIGYFTAEKTGRYWVTDKGLVLQEETCGFCEKPCGESWCATKVKYED